MGQHVGFLVADVRGSDAEAFPETVPVGILEEPHDSTGVVTGGRSHVGVVGEQALTKGAPALFCPSTPSRENTTDQNRRAASVILRFGSEALEGE
jgi:hypothetical protein